jgi:hypothetical protein
MTNTQKPYTLSDFRVLRSRRLLLPLVAGALSLTTSALAQDEDDETVTTLGHDPVLTLDPTIPQVGSLPGGLQPSYGEQSGDAGDWRFDFHGMLIAPLRVGLNERDDPSPNQSSLVLHAPPRVPDDKETFSHTGVVPTPYAQLNFSYGNNIVTGNVSILAEQATVAAGYFDPPSQAGINDLYLTIAPDLGISNMLFKVNVGAFSNRYGTTGEYDEGQYGTPLIARINGVGENIIGAYSFGDFTLMLEQGIMGQTGKAGAGITPDAWNDYADPNVHAGVGYKGIATLAGHYLNAFSQDDTASGTLQPDGSIRVLAADLRLSLGRFGHLYGAFSQVNAEYATTVGRIIQVLNTKGGPGLIDNYLGEGSNGNGKLSIVGGEYRLSIGRLVSYPVPFNANGPDLVVSAFGMLAKVKSDDPDPRFHDVSKLKMGGEVAYSPLSWLALSTRYDRVSPDLDNERFAFAVISPRIIFHTDWASTDQVVLQYSRWLNGSLVSIRTGAPPEEDPTAIPDENMISLSANMWW